MKILLKNPLTQWMWWVMKTLLLRHKYSSNHLEIGYMATVNATNFGNYNRICAGAMLSQVSIGDMSYVGERSRFSNVKIGKFCSIGPDVLAGIGTHPSRDFVSTHPAFFSPNKRAGRSFVSESGFVEFSHIEIGHDVWIGARAVLLDGVKIGTGAIIGAGAVVNKDIPPYGIAVGVPARIIRKRFNEEQISRLLESSWWDLKLDELERRSLSLRNVNSFFM